MRVFAEIAREQRLLNVAGDIDFLLESLAFALSFNEAGIVKDARGVGGESIENLAVEFGEGRRRDGANRGRGCRGNPRALR